MAVSPRGTVVQIAIDGGPIVEGVRLGDSIAINGTDLTVTTMAGTTLRFEMVQETASITNLGLLRHAQSISLSDTGHFAALEQPARFAEIVLNSHGP